MKHPAGSRPERYIFDRRRGNALEIWRNRFVEVTAHIENDPRVRRIDAFYRDAQAAWCAGELNDADCREQLAIFHAEASKLLREMATGK